MININLESLLDFLQKNDYESDIQVDTKQVYTILKIENKEYPLFIRIFDEGHLLQILTFIPCQLEAKENLNSSSSPSSVLADVARLLHLLNKELDIPGFGMDEAAGVIFYRLMLPTPKKKIEADLMLAFLKTVEHVCQMFSAPIEAISAGHATLDEILVKAKEIDKPLT